METTYRIRPWQAGDDLELLQIWPDAETTQAAGFRAMFAPDAENAHWSRTLVAEVQGIPVAAGTVYETSLHNRRLWCYIEVAPDHRRQGIGSALLEELRKLASDAPGAATALRTKVAIGSAGADFAQRNGLRSIQRSRIIRVEPGSFPMVPLQDDGNGNTIQAVEDIATGSVELTQKLWDFYRKSHEWDPPAAVDLGRVNRLFLSDEAEAYGAIVLRDDVQAAKALGKKGDIKAFAVSYRALAADMPGYEIADDAATEVLLGYDFDYAGAREAIMQLLSLLAYQYPVTLEVDDSMEDLAVMINHLLKMGSARVEEETLVLAED